MATNEFNQAILMFMNSPKSNRKVIELIAKIVHTRSCSNNIVPVNQKYGFMLSWALWYFYQEEQQQQQEQEQC
jgi:hypothetical protein